MTETQTERHIDRHTQRQTEKEIKKKQKEGGGEKCEFTFVAIERKRGARESKRERQRLTLR